MNAGLINYMCSIFNCKPFFSTERESAYYRRKKALLVESTQNEQMTTYASSGHTLMTANPKEIN